MNIKEAVKKLLAIVSGLRKSYPKKQFTLDGRLVGDLGETLAEKKYAIVLYENIKPLHDARTKDGRPIQIKTTMKNLLGFPCNHIPDCYLGLKILHDGTLEEIYNGPGGIVWEKIKHRKKPKNRPYLVSLKILRAANERVEAKDRIPKRRG